MKGHRHVGSTPSSFAPRWLGRAVQAAGAAAGALSCGRLFASPRSRGFKIGTLDGCLGKQSDPAAFDIAKQIGFDGVQIDMGGARNNMHLRRPEVQKQFLAAAKRTGLEIASMTISKMLDVPLKNDPRAAVWLGQSVDICKALGLKIVLVPQFNAGELDLDKPAEIDYFLRALKAAAPKAEKAGVTFGLENYLECAGQPADHRPDRLAGRQGVLRRRQFDR